MRRPTSNGGRLPVAGGRAAAPQFVLAIFTGLAVSAATAAQDIDALGKRLLESTSRTERIKIIEELGNSGKEAALGHILVALGDENLAVRKRAGTAVASVLKRAGGDGPARLLVDEALSVDLTPAGQLGVIGLLDEQSPPRDAAAAILRFLERGDLAENAARQCVNSLRKSRYQELDVVRDGLIEQLEDGDVKVAAAAASALATMKLSGSEKTEVVQALVDQLGLEGDDAPVREAATEALGLVTGEGAKTRSEWRSWAVEEGLGDPMDLVPERAVEDDGLPVIEPPYDPGTNYFVSSLMYVAFGGGAVAIVVVLLFLRSSQTKRSVKAIEARRKKVRRSI